MSGAAPGSDAWSALGLDPHRPVPPPDTPELLRLTAEALELRREIEPRGLEPREPGRHSKLESQDRDALVERVLGHDGPYATWLAARLVGRRGRYVADGSRGDLGLQVSRRALAETEGPVHWNRALDLIIRPGANVPVYEFEARMEALAPKVAACTDPDRLIVAFDAFGDEEVHQAIAAHVQVTSPALRDRFETNLKVLAAWLTNPTSTPWRDDLLARVLDAMEAACKRTGDREVRSAKTDLTTLLEITGQAGIHPAPIRARICAWATDDNVEYDLHQVAFSAMSTDRALTSEELMPVAYETADVRLMGHPALDGRGAFERAVETGSATLLHWALRLKPDVFTPTAHDMTRVLETFPNSADAMESVVKHPAATLDHIATVLDRMSGHQKLEVLKKAAERPGAYAHPKIRAFLDASASREIWEEILPDHATGAAWTDYLDAYWSRDRLWLAGKVAERGLPDDATAPPDLIDWMLKESQVEGHRQKAFGLLAVPAQRQRMQEAGLVPRLGGGR